MDKKKKKKLKISDINKNNSGNIFHTISKIKLNEKRTMGLTVCLMVVIIVGICGIVFTSFDGIKKFENKVTGNVFVQYQETLSGIGNVVSLNDESILTDEAGLKTTPYIFNVENSLRKKTKYKVVLEEDEGITKLCGCGDLQVNKNFIKVSLDGNTVVNLEDLKKKNQYVLVEGEIDSLETKEFRLYVWIDNQLVQNPEQSHFHGRIVVKEA